MTNLARHNWYWYFHFHRFIDSQLGRGGIVTVFAVVIIIAVANAAVAI